MPSPVAVIVNLSAGAPKRGKWLAELAEVFRGNGLEAHVLAARRGAEISELARRAARGEYETVVAGGGDGTINTVAGVVLEAGKTLGVLPLGTLNHFAKDLRIPLSLPEAVRNLAQGEAVAVDVGEVNGRIFLNNSNLGLYPRIVRYRKGRERKGLNKWLAFAWAAVAALRRYPFLQVRLSTESQALFRRTPFVFVGNNEYQLEGFNLGGRSCLDAGQLSLYVAHRAGRLGLLRLALRALVGRLRNAEDFDALCARELWVETRRRRLRVATDGEITILRTPLYYRVRPKALRVIVPRAAQDLEELEGARSVESGVPSQAL